MNTWGKTLWLNLLAIGLGLFSIGLGLFTMIHRMETVRDNLNVSASTLRGQSICERTNSTAQSVEVGVIYQGPKRIGPTEMSTVYCKDRVTGAITAREFKSVLYREKGTPDEITE